MRLFGSWIASCPAPPSSAVGKALDPLSPPWPNEWAFRYDPLLDPFSLTRRAPSTCINCYGKNHLHGAECSVFGHPPTERHGSMDAEACDPQVRANVCLTPGSYQPPFGPGGGGIWEGSGGRALRPIAYIDNTAGFRRQGVDEPAQAGRRTPCACLCPGPEGLSLTCSPGCPLASS